VVIALEDPPRVGRPCGRGGQRTEPSHRYPRPGARIEADSGKVNVLLFENVGDCVLRDRIPADCPRRPAVPEGEADNHPGARGCIRGPGSGSLFSRRRRKGPRDAEARPKFRRPWSERPTASTRSGSTRAISGSARRVARIDLARAGDRWLSGSSKCPPTGTRLSMSAEFQVAGTLTGFGLWTDIWFTGRLVARTLSARPWQNLSSHRGPRPDRDIGHRLRGLRPPRARWPRPLAVEWVGEALSGSAFLTAHGRFRCAPRRFLGNSSARRAGPWRQSGSPTS
jgi:hypothetical protein